MRPGAIGFVRPKNISEVEKCISDVFDALVKRDKGGLKWFGLWDGFVNKSIRALIFHDQL